MKEDVAQQTKVILNMSKHRLSLTFRHMISHPSSDQNDSFKLFFWDINKIGGKDYVNSNQAILQTFVLFRNRAIITVILFAKWN